MRVLLDSNAFDELVADRAATEAVDAAIAERRLELLTTHVQEDELAGIKDRAKAAAVARIPRTCVPTGGFVLDVSRLDMARLGPAEPIEAVRTGRHSKHTEDALIAATALWEDVVLVTEDKRLRRRAGEIGVNVWMFDELVRVVRPGPSS